MRLFLFLLFCGTFLSAQTPPARVPEKGVALVIRSYYVADQRMGELRFGRGERRWQEVLRYDEAGWLREARYYVMRGDEGACDRWHVTYDRTTNKKVAVVSTREFLDTTRSRRNVDRDDPFGVGPNNYPLSHREGERIDLDLSDKQSKIQKAFGRVLTDVRSATDGELPDLNFDYPSPSGTRITMDWETGRFLIERITYVSHAKLRSGERGDDLADFVGYWEDTLTTFGVTAWVGMDPFIGYPGSWLGAGYREPFSSGTGMGSEEIESIGDGRFIATTRKSQDTVSLIRWDDRLLFRSRLGYDLLRYQPAFDQGKTINNQLPEGLGYIDSEKRRGIVTTKGDTILPAELELRRIIGDSVLEVGKTTSEHKGYYTISGRRIVSPQYLREELFPYGNIVLQFEDTLTVLDGNGNYLIPPGLLTMIPATIFPGIHAVVGRKDVRLYDDRFNLLTPSGAAYRAYPIAYGGAVIHDAADGTRVMNGYGREVFTTSAVYQNILLLSYGRYLGRSDNDQYDLLNGRGKPIRSFTATALGQHDDQYLIVHEGADNYLLHLPTGVVVVPATEDELVIDTAAPRPGDRYQTRRVGVLRSFNPLTLR